MSSSIAIPKRKQPSTGGAAFASASASSSSSSPYPSWANNAASPSFSPSSMSSTSASPSSASTPSSMARYTERRPSLLGDSLSKSEYTVVNIGGPENPRLITCIKTSQGFDWNQDIFLPSYLDYDSSDLEHRPDPVQEIILTDEEAAAMFPK
ncbi:hypothetical protein E4T42_01082 [Aureobasidium subglaciale]|uniref:Uncharacterized protein n=1 Tax=Aureobasidium subglaciale (strain EXF-2481) TaxID=1043005 RepID=A0A074YPH5_AURSE|nr:uncharacterized protein AUEXF2481DRAFT_35598 [Aureobasidium subglaciale EXF-2481]KAI5204668.1 hypothetical protein E4T38_04659 [Aureobasidium subglaciale]KAI5223824.1 hypothetical protein E4T40_04435 [Aureobasidium subglaciale]KAI5227086.1 hypothetical protein E4T41_04438 [Aureobasidium subglaciale]KAI5257376.1 hypothetical protein E4T42_01082 [Aureobasidium subglaciale]KAI5262550.1 hypothetical protein E4T46_04324 [Aureobasidium subglaciale]